MELLEKYFLKKEFNLSPTEVDDTPIEVIQGLMFITDVMNKKGKLNEMVN